MASSLLKRRGGFMAQAIGLMIVQLCITFALFYFIREHPVFGAEVTPYAWAFGLLAILFLIPTLFIESTTIKLFFFTCYSILIGFMLSTLRNVPQKIIESALMSVLAIFVSMLLVGIALSSMGVDLSLLGFILSGILLGVLIVCIVDLIYPTEGVTRIIRFIMVPLMSLYVVYDTNVIMSGGVDNVVDASVMYYTDVLNLFINLINYD